MYPPAEQFMIALWLAILIIALLCGIFAEQQTTVRENTRCLRIIYKHCESPIERLLEMSSTTSLRLRLFEVYKSINQLNPKCLNCLFEEKSTSYSLRYPAKVLQPKKRTTMYSLISISYTVKPVYNDHLMGYFSAFWSSSRWPRAT